MEGCERGRKVKLRGSRYTRDMWKAEREAGREEGSSRSKRGMWKAERKAGKEERQQVQRRHAEGCKRGREARGEAVGPKELRGRQEGKRGGSRSKRDMGKAVKEAGKGRGEAGPKETCGRLRGRQGRR